MILVLSLDDDEIEHWGLSKSKQYKSGWYRWCKPKIIMTHLLGLQMHRHKYGAGFLSKLALLLGSSTCRDKNPEVYCHLSFSVPPSTTLSSASFFFLSSLISSLTPLAPSPPMKSPPQCAQPNTQINTFYILFSSPLLQALPPLPTCSGVLGAKKTKHTQLCDYTYTQVGYAPNPHTHTQRYTHQIYCKNLHRQKVFFWNKFIYTHKHRGWQWAEGSV